MKKILLDLDVVTVAFWDKKGKQKELADTFIQRIQNNEFFVGTPFLLVELVLLWKHEGLKQAIRDFYVQHSSRFFSDAEIRERCRLLQVDYEPVLTKLEGAGIKREDAALVLIGSLFSYDYLVTFNRKHLRNKKEEAKNILTQCNLSVIGIVGPEEL